MQLLTTTIQKPSHVLPIYQTPKIATIAYVCEVDLFLCGIYLSHCPFSPPNSPTRTHEKKKVPQTFKNKITSTYKIKNEKEKEKRSYFRHPIMIYINTSFLLSVRKAVNHPLLLSKKLLGIYARIIKIIFLIIIQKIININ